MCECSSLSPQKKFLLLSLINSKRAACRVLLPALMHSMIILAARPTGIASLGVPIALKKGPEAVIIPEVVTRYEGLGRRLAHHRRAGADSSGLAKPQT
jgi:hypothetical protein